MAGIYGPCVICGGGIGRHHRMKTIDEGRAHLKCLQETHD